MTEPNQEQLSHLARLLVETCPDEIDCEQFIDRLAVYFEHRQKGEEIPPELAVVEQHFRVCPECEEEYEALVMALG